MACGEADEGSCEARTSTENREAMDPLTISLKQTSEIESDTDDWPTALE
jgi:hypothetical protein